jgi:hypothetical protein
MTDQWPSSTRVKKVEQARRLLEKMQRTIAAVENSDRRVDADTRKLVQALEWSLKEITRLEQMVCSLLHPDKNTTKVS